MAENDTDKEQKTEQATDKRRKDAREKGQVAKSKELTSVFVMIGALITFHSAGTYMFTKIMTITKDIFSQSAQISVTKINIPTLFNNYVKEFLIIIFPIMAVTLTVGVVSNIIQTQGFLYAPDALSFKFSKIDPVKGMSRIFSKQSLAELFKSIFKIAIVGFIAYSTVKGEFDNIPVLVDMNAWQLLAYTGGVASKIFFRTIIALMVMALTDYAFQKYEHEESLKMTKEEVKEEMKNTEGNPLIKSRIKSVQKDLARRRMMEAVPDADVVITNPTRLSVAIKYDRAQMFAPKVIAKGQGFVAKRIREIAKEKGVPLVENKPVAQTLFKTVKVGQSVPEDLYKAIAEILAYVYKLKPVY